MNKKVKKMIFLLPIMILFSITFNFVQKTLVDNGHTHYEHDSLIHIHQHTHSDNHTHSHYHSSNTVSVLDCFCINTEGIYLDRLQNNKPLESVTFYINDLKNTLFKPPKIS